MKKPTALIFGHHGGIGSATQSAFLSNGFRIIPVNRDLIDFNQEDSDQQIQMLLNNSQPAVVVNCSGVFENGHSVAHHNTMNVNFGSNWSIIRFYMNPDNQKKNTRIIMVGSSSYKSGRRLYPLYSASKAAVYNLWQSARDCFETTPITVDLLNPVRTLTKMSTAGKEIDPNLDYLSPQQVANKIVELVNENQVSSCIDLNFEDEK